MLILKDISKTYNIDKYNKVEALKTTSLIFKDKGLNFIYGPSGSGKSTLLNIIGGLLTPTTGTITYNGIILNKDNIDRYINQKVGFVFQNFNLINSYTIYENIMLAVRITGNNINEEEIDEILRKLNIYNLKHRKVRDLSGGEIQRAAIARALAKNVDVIIADEPTGNLDSKNSEDIFKLLKEIANDKLVIVVSHDKEKASLYANRIIEIIDGYVVNDSLEVKDINEKKENLNKNKKLSFKTIIKLGFSSITIKISRLIAIIILSIVSLVGVAFSISCLKFNVDKYACKEAINKGYDELVISSNRTYSKETILKINEITNKRFIPILPRTNGVNTIDINLNFKEELNNNFSSYLSIYNEEDFKDNNLEIIVGKIPLEIDEIIISDVLFSFYVEQGYIDGTNILKYDDLIGKTIEISVEETIGRFNYYSYKISGVFKTKIEDKTNYLSLNYVSFINEESYNTNIKLFDYYDSYYMISKMIDDPNQLYKLFKFLEEYNEGHFVIKNLINTHDLKEFTSSFVKIFLPIAIILLFFTCYLIYSYINMCMKHKQRELGILKSLGIKNRDTLMIYYITSGFLVSIISTIISSIITYILVGCFNKLEVNRGNLTVFPLSFNYIEILAVLLITLISSFIAIVIPIYKNNKKDIIDIIRIDG